MNTTPKRVYTHLFTSIYIASLGLCTTVFSPAQGNNVYKLKDGTEVSFTSQGDDVWTAQVMDGFDRVLEPPRSK